MAEESRADPTRRAVITGVGFACPAGVGSHDVFRNFVEGQSAIHDEQLEHPVARVRDFDPVEALGSKKDARRADRVTQLGLTAAAEALAHADLKTGEFDEAAADRAGVIVGTGIGGITTLLEQHLTMLDKGPGRVSPLLVPMFMPNATGAAISLKYGLRGPNTTVTTACAAGGHAIGDAALAIQSGVADIMITGGAEACIGDLTIAAFQNLGALTKSGSRPFDLNRDGFVMGEGAAVLVLESLAHAEARGATPLAEVAGYGRTADAHHITAPHPEGAGAVRAMHMALDQARLDTGDVGYVNAHGTSTPLNDKAEAEALGVVFGDDVPPASSTKSVTGHLIGAAGACEAAITAFAIADGVLPPTINYETPDPEIAIDVVPNEAREAPELSAAISNSFGFGGHNAVLALRRV